MPFVQACAMEMSCTCMHRSESYQSGSLRTRWGLLSHSAQSSPLLTSLTDREHLPISCWRGNVPLICRYCRMPVRVRGVRRKQHERLRQCDNNIQMHYLPTHVPTPRLNSCVASSTDLPTYDCLSSMQAWARWSYCCEVQLQPSSSFASDMVF